jgi:membrane protein YdbS with pleckstrin-like domain|uniref:Membrane protein n=1 Tax=Lactococcus lactis TaxID=1358 RepID=L0N4X0_9LACT|nr:membrane protein [Lactococcus lactis]
MEQSTLKKIDNDSVTFKVSKQYINLFISENILGLILGVILFSIILLLKKGGIFSLIILIISLIFFIVSLLDIFLYKRLASIKYTIQSGKLLIKKGKLFKKRTIIFTNKIFSIEKVTNPLNRKFGLLTIKILLINKDIEIRGLSLEDAEMMMKLLESQINNNVSQNITAQYNI